MSGFRNKPKILRGAFVEYGLSDPPQYVAFQFNPVQLSRSRGLSFSAPGLRIECPPEESEESQPNRIIHRDRSLRQWHQKKENLLEIQESQEVTIEEESINFELRLDATDGLNDGDAISEQFGILPRLATLELMMHPKSESLVGENPEIKAESGFSFTKRPNPPLILFIWGRTRVLPVNIDNMSITETEFNTDLHPIRATVAVSMKVIEGPSAPYLYSKAFKEMTAEHNLANVTEIANVVIPG